MKSWIKDGLIGAIVALITWGLALMALVGSANPLGGTNIAANTALYSYIAAAIVGAVIGIIIGALLNLIQKK